MINAKKIIKKLNHYALKIHRFLFRMKFDKKLKDGRKTEVRRRKKNRIFVIVSLLRSPVFGLRSKKRFIETKVTAINCRVLTINQKIKVHIHTLPTRRRNGIVEEN
jgi:hypothetical protein